MSRFLDCTTPAGKLRVRIADNFVSRALGLLVGTPLGPAEALLIAPCSSIHTFGMRYPIDVVFVDWDARIVRAHPRVRTGRIRIAPGAKAVLELCAGVAAQQGLAPGVRLAELAAALA
jgi:uncharacterized membrane protein (UPF0127 family)